MSRQPFAETALKIALTALNEGVPEEERAFAARVLTKMMPLGLESLAANRVRAFLRLVQMLPPAKRPRGLTHALGPLLSGDEDLCRVVLELDKFASKEPAS